MKKHSNTFIRFFQIFIATVVFSILTFCSSLKASPTFTQDFLSNCYLSADFIQNTKDYTVLRREFLYKNETSTVYDVLIVENKTKRVLAVREFSNRVSALCVLSEFTFKNKM